VNLRREEFAFDVLQEWKQSQAVLAIVMPPDSRILRLRAIDDLQPLTLRRVDTGGHDPIGVAKEDAVPVRSHLVMMMR